MNLSKNILGVFDSSEVEGIALLVDKLAKSPFDYLKLEADGVSLVIGKSGVVESTVETAPRAKAPAQAAAEDRTPELDQPAREESGGEAAPSEAEPSPGRQTVAEEQPGIAVITSPSFGMFYAQPQPGAPPYVTVGSRVKKGDTIGLLEIMKTFNAITSDYDGEVIAIHVKNEELLEPGQPLVSVRVE